MVAEAKIPETKVALMEVETETKDQTDLEAIIEDHLTEVQRLIENHPIQKKTHANLVETGGIEKISIAVETRTEALITNKVILKEGHSIKIQEITEVHLIENLSTEKVHQIEVHHMKEEGLLKEVVFLKGENHLTENHIIEMTEDHQIEEDLLAIDVFPLTVQAQKTINMVAEAALEIKREKTKVHLITKEAMAVIDLTENHLLVETKNLGIERELRIADEISNAN